MRDREYSQNRGIICFTKRESFVFFFNEILENVRFGVPIKNRKREKKQQTDFGDLRNKSERNQRGGEKKKIFRELRNLCETYFISEILYLYIMYSDCGTSFYVILPLCYRVLD